MNSDDQHPSAPNTPTTVRPNLYPNPRSTAISPPTTIRRALYPDLQTREGTSAEQASNGAGNQHYLDGQPYRAPLRGAPTSKR